MWFNEINSLHKYILTSVKIYYWFWWRLIKIYLKVYHVFDRFTNTDLNRIVEVFFSRKIIMVLNLILRYYFLRIFSSNSDFNRFVLKIPTSLSLLTSTERALFRRTCIVLFKFTSAFSLKILPYQKKCYIYWLY